MTVKRVWMLLVLSLALVAGLGLLTFHAVTATPPPAALEPQPPDHPPLTKQLVLVIVDGLRYDIATDAKRMPHFAAAMERHSSAEIWSSPISMTSSAVLAYSAGQPGDLDQIINNETAEAIPYNHLPGNVQRAGLVTAAVGDIAWFRYHPDSWDLAQPDPRNVAIHVDYNAETFAGAYRFLRAEPRPNLLIFHFVTPDHQGHAYGVDSERYRAHIRNFDAELRQLLDAIDSDSTLFVTSDHGATARGKHGSDAPVQRSSPLFAYGPGIRSGVHPGAHLRQLELPDTFAYLLGVSAPAHGEGHVLARWLDLPEPQQAEAACSSLARFSRYATASIGSAADVEAVTAGACAADLTPAQRLERSERASFALGRLVRARAPAESFWLWPLLFGAALLALVVGAGWSGADWRRRLRSWMPSILICALLLALALYVTSENEKLPGRWPLLVPVTLTVAVNLALLLALLVLPRTARFVERHQPLVAAALLGALVVSYTPYTRVQSYVVVAVTVVVLVVAPIARRLKLAERGMAPHRSAIALLVAAAISVIAIYESSFFPRWLLRPDARWWGIVGGALVLFAAERLARRPDDRRSTPRLLVAGVLVVLIGLGSWQRSAVPAALGLAAWLGLPAIAWVAWRRGWRTVAELLLVLCFALLSRGTELLILLATYLLAETVGDAVGTALRRRPGVPARHAVVVALVAFVFSLTFVQRIGVQSGMDLTHNDWGAGTFDSLGASYLRIGGALTTKHVLARAGVLFACLLPLAAELRMRVLRGLVLVELGRALVLVAMLFVCRRSFWTSLRVLGDLPHGLIGAAVAVAACALLALKPLDDDAAARGVLGPGPETLRS